MLSVIVGTLLSGVALVLRDHLLNAFLRNAEVLVIGRVCLYPAVAVGPFFGIYQICTTYLQATGKSTAAIIASLLQKVLLLLPALFLLNASFGFYGLIFADTSATLLSTAAAFLYCRNRFRKELQFYES